MIRLLPEVHPGQNTTIIVRLVRLYGSDAKIFYDVCGKQEAPQSPVRACSAGGWVFFVFFVSVSSFFFFDDQN